MKTFLFCIWLQLLIFGKSLTSSFKVSSHHFHPERGQPLYSCDEPDQPVHLCNPCEDIQSFWSSSFRDKPTWWLRNERDIEEKQLESDLFRWCFWVSYLTREKRAKENWRCLQSRSRKLRRQRTNPPMFHSEGGLIWWFLVESGCQMDSDGFKHILGGFAVNAKCGCLT